MEDWKPDKVRRVRNVKIYYQPIPETRDAYVYFWAIPAKVDGDWQWTFPRPGGIRDYTLHLVQKFQEFSGKMTAGGQESPVKNGRLDGDQLRFTAKERIDGRDVAMGFNGRVQGPSIQGIVEIKEGPLTGKYPWTARRRF